MKFLVIVQDLRISGTSEGIVSRSFLSKLRTAYPESVIDVVYLKQYASEDRLDLLPVSSIQSHILNLKIPFHILWWNKIFWRLFHRSLKERYIHKVYASYIKKLNYQLYDHVFIRSSGLNYETILGAKGLPILKNAIINFHDPYPVFWDTGAKSSLTNLELFRLKEMQTLVAQAKLCITPAHLLSNDMSHLYGSIKKFYTLPHQYSKDVFDFSNVGGTKKKQKQITISYHGAIQFGRDMDVLLDAYEELLHENTYYQKHTEFVLRLRGSHNRRLQAKYSATPNIVILNTLDFVNSSSEQIHEADILIVLENCAAHSNILVGKAPFLASLEKPILSLSPERSEMRALIKDIDYVAQCADKEEIKQKLENLIIIRMNSKEAVYPFGDYFSDENFNKMFNEILKYC